MRLEILSDDVRVTPVGYKTLSVEIDCDVWNVVSQLSPNDVIANMSISELLDGISGEVCADHFGDNLINHFTIDEVLEQFPIEDIIKHIGHEKFKSYIREIFIDDIINK